METPKITCLRLDAFTYMYSVTRYYEVFVDLPPVETYTCSLIAQRAVVTAQTL